MPVNRSRLWALRHLISGSLFCLAMLFWYILSHASDKLMLDNYIKLFSEQDRLILLFLGGCIIFAVSSELSSMMESNFTSAFAGFLSGLAVIFIVRKSPLAYPYFDWLLSFSVVYFLIVSLDLLACGQPLSFRSLWRRFSLLLHAFLCIMYIMGLFLQYCILTN